jgi:hypothetical protein
MPTAEVLSRLNELDCVRKIPADRSAIKIFQTRLTPLPEKRYVISGFLRFLKAPRTLQDRLVGSRFRLARSSLGNHRGSWGLCVFVRCASATERAQLS